MCPLLVPPTTCFQSKPPLPLASARSILKPCLSVPRARRPCPSSLCAPSPLSFPHTLISSWVRVSMLLFPCPQVCLHLHSPHASSPWVASNRGLKEGRGHHLGPLPLFSPANHLGLSVLDFSEKLGPPGASQRRLVPVAPALLQPPLAPVGLCGSTPGLHLHPSLQLLPPPAPESQAQEQDFT